MEDTLHDGHSSHFEGQQAQTKPISNNYQRAIELNKYTPPTQQGRGYIDYTQQREPRY